MATRSRRPLIPDIQFYAHDSDPDRLQKLRRLAQSVNDYMRAMQPTETVVNPTVEFNITGPAIAGKATSGNGPAGALTGTQATALLNVFSVTLKGLVPPPVALSPLQNRFLNENGSWSAPNLAGLSHGSLSGLAANDHPQYLLAVNLNPFARSFLFMGA